jgi:LacI family transcriptional regulator, gluconate utilization system Gnt-I transcriptional repressor
MAKSRTPVKLSDVATAAGVAPMTVSRVINTPEQVAPETAERVRAAIEHLGYVPNLLAGGLSSRRSRIVAAIVPTIASPMFSASVQAFTDTLDAAGYHVVLGLSGYSEPGEEALVAAILGRRPDGLLLTGVTRSPATRRRLAMAGVPVVEIWDLADQPTDMVVGFDHRAVGAAVASFFLGRGYRRFASIGADDIRAVARRDGFSSGLPPGSMVFDRTMPAPASIQGGRDAVADLPLAAEPIALFCTSDSPAAGAVIEAAVRGIAVPKQLAVCGFGDFELARALHPAITTVSVDGAEIGRVAAQSLLCRLAGQATPQTVAVPFRIVERGST